MHKGYIISHLWIDNLLSLFECDRIDELKVRSNDQKIYIEKKARSGYGLIRWISHCSINKYKTKTYPCEIG